VFASLQNAPPVTQSSCSQFSQAVWLLSRMSLIHQPSPRSTVCKSFPLPHQLRSVATEVNAEMCLCRAAPSHPSWKRRQLPQSKLFTPPFTSHLSSLYVCVCDWAFVTHLFFFFCKAYKGWFTFFFITSSHELRYRLSVRLSPASPNHFYPACRDSSGVVKSLQSRDRDRTEEWVCAGFFSIGVCMWASFRV